MSEGSKNSKRSYRKLKSTSLLKRLMKRSYIENKLTSYFKPVAWISSGAPVEFVLASGMIPVYPENYGALCGARQIGQRLCQIAEDAGYSIDLCSYARSNLGAMFRPNLAPQGGLFRPKCIITASNLCNTLLKWFQRSAEYFDIPHFVLDIPFLFEDQIPVLDSEYIKSQFYELISFLERVSSKRFNESKLRYVLQNSSEAIRLWQSIRETGMNSPSPLNAPDLFIHMAPIVNLRGLRRTISYYKTLLKELEDRVAAKIGAIKQEKYRFIWDNIAIWFNLFDLFTFFSDRNVCFVSTTYTDAWSGDWDEKEDPYEALARIYQQVYLNRSLTYRVNQMVTSIERYNINGIVLHSDRSCKPYSLGQSVILEQVREKTGVPGILIDGDMTDPRYYSDSQIKSRLEAFLEMIE